MIEFVHDLEPVYGKCQKLSPLVRRVTCPNASPFTYTGTGSFIIGNGTVAILDPGPLDMAHLEAICAALEPGETVSHILVTHTHSDHSPLATALKEKTHALICGGADHSNGTGVYAPDTPELLEGVTLEEACDKNYQPDILLKDGDMLTGPDWTIEAVFTPGHIHNHFCFALKEEQTLFTGDHIMGWSTSIIAPPDGNMVDYMNSLSRLLERYETCLRPTHGPAITEAKPFIQAYIDHRKQREAQIIEQLKAGEDQIKPMVAKIYADIDARLHPAAAMSMLAHLQALVANGTVLSDGGIGLNNHYRLAN